MRSPYFLSLLFLSDQFALYILYAKTEWFGWSETALPLELWYPPTWHILALRSQAVLYHARI